MPTTDAARVSSLRVQAAHGFTRGIAVRYDPVGGWTRGTAGDAGLGLVGSILDANRFEFVQAGFIDNLADLSAGLTYYVSTTGDGSLTTTPTASPIFSADSATTGFVFSAGGTAAGGDTGAVTEDDLNTRISSEIARTEITYSKKGHAHDERYFRCDYAIIDVDQGGFVIDVDSGVQVLLEGAIDVVGDAVITPTTVAEMSTAELQALIDTRISIHAAIDYTGGVHGLGSMASQSSSAVTISGGSITNLTALTTLGNATITGNLTVTGTITGGSFAGLGTMSTQNANAVAITGGSATGLTTLTASQITGGNFLCSYPNYFAFNAGASGGFYCQAQNFTIVYNTNGEVITAPTGLNYTNFNVGTTAGITYSRTDGTGMNVHQVTCTSTDFYVGLGGATQRWRFGNASFGGYGFDIYKSSATTMYATLAISGSASSIITLTASGGCVGAQLILDGTGNASSLSASTLTVGSALYFSGSSYFQAHVGLSGVGLQFISGSFGATATVIAKVDDSTGITISSGYRLTLANGTVYNNGVQILSARQSAVTAPTGGSTTDTQARTAINDIINRLQSHGLIS